MNKHILRAELRRDEGLELKPYRDSVGKLSLGIGRNLDDKGISTDEALYLLDNDINEVMADLDRAFPWWRTLSEKRQRVMANMCFNLGLGRLSGFKKTLAAIQAGDYKTAAVEMLDSKWHDDVGVRAERLAEMMENGEDGRGES